MDDLPQPKDEFWLPSLIGPLPARNIPQYQPTKQHWGRKGHIVFSIVSVVVVAGTLLIPYTGPVIAVLLFGFAVILNIAVWMSP